MVCLHSTPFFHPPPKLYVFLPVFAPCPFFIPPPPLPQAILFPLTTPGFELADANGFWTESIASLKAKMDLFNAIWDELGIPYSEPEGGYFVMVNLASVEIPEGYPFPPHVASRPRDYKLAWLLIQELGVAAIPPTEFYTDANAHIAEDYLRFAVCKEDSVLEEAKERLRGLKKFLKKKE